MHPIVALSAGMESALFMVLPLIGSTLLALGIYQVIVDSRRVSRKKLIERLKGDSKRKTGRDVASILKKSITDAENNELLARVTAKLKFIPKLQTLLDQANVPWRASRMTLNLVIAAIGVVVLLKFSGIGTLTALGCALAVLIGPVLVLSLRRRRRMSKLTYQLPDVFAMMSQALRAGHSLASAIQLVSEEMPDPISTEFARVFHEQNLGIKVEDALMSMADRVDSLDVRFFVTAVLIQRQTGGDLAEVLDKIGDVIQERIQLFGQVKGLTAEGRLSGWVLFALPFIVFIATMFLNPDYANVLLTDPRGKLALILAAGMQLMGMAMIRMIVNIKV